MNSSKTYTPIQWVIRIIGLIMCVRFAFFDFPRSLDNEGWSIISITYLLAIVLISVLLVRGPISRAANRS